MNVVCLAGCDFNATWQPTQEIMTRLAQMGHRVLYINPTGTRYPCLSDISRLWKRRQAQASHVNLTIYSPLVLPFPFSWLIARINRRILMRRIRAWLQGQPCDIAWTWFASPLNVQVIGALWPKKVVYQIMSSIRAVRSQPAIHDAEDKLMSHATAIFVNSDTLRQEYGQRYTKIYVFRAGCNTALFDPSRTYQRPPDLPTGKPIIGYSGGLHEWFDELLWLQLSNQFMGRYHFVIVTGKKHDELPAYLAHFDVCLIPYKADAYTATSFPAKLNEYLAMKKRVVAIRTRELEAYQKEAGINLLLSSTLDEWVANIQKSVDHLMPADFEQRRFAAIQHDYSYQVPKMLELLA